MGVITKEITLHTEGFGDTHDITPESSKFILESGLSEGILTVFVPGSTAGITTIEFESGAVRDLADVMEKIVPEDTEYFHNQRWHDGNGFSHVRSAMIGPSLTVPFKERKLTLGTWQQIILLDFDNNPRTRRVVLQVMGE
ncbi:MAG: YjbQ family protein [Acidobacteria bacterium]|nr:YjbQ family protein [Acidobacteriota bacterium]